MAILFQITESTTMAIHGRHGGKVRCHANAVHLRQEEVGMGLYYWRWGRGGLLDRVSILHIVRSRRADLPTQGAEGPQNRRGPSSVSLPRTKNDPTPTPSAQRLG